MMGNFLCFAILRLLCCATTRPIMRASCGPWLDLSFRVSSSLALLLELRTGRESESERENSGEPRTKQTVHICEKGNVPEMF